MFKFVSLLCFLLLMFQGNVSAAGFQLIRSGRPAVKGVIIRSDPTPSEERAAYELVHHLCILSFMIQINFNFEKLKWY